MVQKSFVVACAEIQLLTWVSLSALQMLRIISGIDAPNPSEEVRQEAIKNPAWILARILMDMLSTEEKFYKFLEVSQCKKVSVCLLAANIC